jgi:uncharacterized protein (UPF0335 family)
MYTDEQRLEKFGVADEEGVIQIDRVAEKKDFIQRGVRLKHEQETLAEDLKSVLEEAKERGYDKKRLKQLIDNTYRNEIEEKISELQEIQTELDNLFGDSSEED